jgi:hypothetical protein
LVVANRDDAVYLAVHCVVAADAPSTAALVTRRLVIIVGVAAVVIIETGCTVAIRLVGEAPLVDFEAIVITAVVAPTNCGAADGGEGFHGRADVR